MTYLSVNMQKNNFIYLLYCEVIEILMEMFPRPSGSGNGCLRVSELDVGSGLNLHEDLSLF